MSRYPIMKSSFISFGTVLFATETWSQTNEMQLSPVEEAVHSYVSKKDQGWETLSNTFGTREYGYKNSCTNLSAKNCYYYELSHRKVKPRTKKVFKTFSRSCKANGGTPNANPQSDKEISNFIYGNLTTSSRLGYEVEAQQMFCAYANKPETGIVVVSEHAYRTSGGNLLIRSTLYERPNIYVFILNMDR